MILWCSLYSIPEILFKILGRKVFWLVFLAKSAVIFLLSESIKHDQAHNTVDLSKSIIAVKWWNIKYKDCKKSNGKLSGAKKGEMYLYLILPITTFHLNPHTCFQHLTLSLTKIQVKLFFSAGKCYKSCTLTNWYLKVPCVRKNIFTTQA